MPWIEIDTRFIDYSITIDFPLKILVIPTSKQAVSKS